MLNERVLSSLIEWMQEQMLFADGKKAVVGISGGKDSTVVCALCVKAFGRENVYGVRLPNGQQHDIAVSKEVCFLYGINHLEINIENAVTALTDQVQTAMSMNLSQTAVTNLPARVRMSTLYAVAQTLGDARVINTSNLSEDYVGYATLYGDNTGAFSPLGNFTTEEVIQIGKLLGVPEKFLYKTPEDGLCGKTDEDNLGFSYATLNQYIREGICQDESIKQKIDTMHKNSRFKFEPMPMFQYAVRQEGGC